MFPGLGSRKARHLVIAVGLSSRRPRWSVILVPVDHRSARTRQPDAITLDTAVKLTAAVMLLTEGGEFVDER